MKAKFEMLCIIVLGLCFSGCGVKNAANDDTLRWTTAVEDNRVLSTEAIEETSSIMAETVEDTFEYYSDIRYAERYKWASLSEYGVINNTYAFGDNLLDIIVRDVGKEVVFCDILGCKHPNIPVAAGTPECKAALYAHISGAYYYNGMIYFTVYNGTNESRIYEMDIKSGERRLLARLPFMSRMPYFTIFSDDKMYFMTVNVREDKITGVKEEMNRIVECSLHDGSYRFLTEETKDHFTEAHLTEDMLWVRRADMSDEGRFYMEIIDINTLEEKVVINKDEWKLGGRYIDVYDKDSYYYWDKVTYKIGIKNIDGTVEKILVQGAEGEDFCPADPSGDKLFYTRNYDFGDKKAGSYFMDVTTGEIVDITEEAQKYNIEGYDCYYDVFLSWNEEVGVAMWSREKIIEEALADE